MGMLFSIAWRNLWRNPRRSILSMLAIAFAVMILLFSMALQQGSYADMINNALSVHTGFMQVQKPGYNDDQDIIKAFGKSAEIEKILMTNKHVKAVAPRINGPALVSIEENTSGALIFGIDPEKEKQVTTLAQIVREGEYLKQDDKKGVLIGQTLAKNMGAKIGDEIGFLGQGADGSMAAGLLTVRGIYKFGQKELDRSTMVAHIDTLSDAYSMYGRVHEVAIKIDHLNNLDETHKDLQSKLTAAGFTNVDLLTWVQLLPGVKQSIDIDWKSGQIMYYILLMVVGFGIMNTFLMSFLERTREFGVLMSIGMKPRQCSFMLLIESMLLTISGLLIGILVGSGIVFYFQKVGIDFGETGEAWTEMGISPIIHPQLSLWLIGYTCLLVLIVSGIVAIYPAVKVTRLRAVEAMRQV